MSKNNKVIFILVDALRWDYINKDHSPFLNSLSESGVSGSAIPSFGFEPDAAYIAGLNPKESNGGAMFWINPDNSDFKFSRFIPNVLDSFPNKINWMIRKIIRLIAQFFGKTKRIRKYCDPCYIPIKYLNKFSYSTVMSDYPWEKDFMKNSTIFHLLAKNKIKFFYHCIPDNKVKSKVVYERFIKKYDESYDFSFLFIGDLDGVGHEYGPNSNERKKTLRHVDKYIEKIYNYARLKNNNLDIVILGDHGMADVKHQIDIQDYLESLKKDLNFDYFLDATMLRIWINNSNHKEIICTKINQIDGLIYLDDNMIKQYDVNYKHNYFWDECWQVKENYIIHPNFFGHGKSPLGMHGYLPETQDNNPAYIINSNTIKHNLRGLKKNDIDMRLFFEIQKSFLGLTKVNINELLE